MIRILNSNLGESRSAIKMERNPLHGYTLVRDVNIYLETDNLGVPQSAKTLDNKPVDLGRSTPGYFNLDDGTRNGIWIRGEGPVHIHNVNFHNIASNPIERFCAITLRANSPRAMGMSSSTKGLTFNGLDTTTEYEGVPAASKICRSRMANLNELDDENKADCRVREHQHYACQCQDLSLQHMRWHLQDDLQHLERQHGEQSQQKVYSKEQHHRIRGVQRQHCASSCRSNRSRWRRNQGLLHLANWDKH